MYLSITRVAIALTVPCFFASSNAQWVHCDSRYGSPSLQSCHDALSVMGAVGNPSARMMVGPRNAAEEPNIYLPFSIQVCESSHVLPSASTSEG